MPQYPLGLFDTPGATTAIQPLRSFEPPLKLKFDYFTDANGKTHKTAKLPGPGPTWVTGYTSLPDSNGAPRLVGSYMKIRNYLEVYEWGLCVWNDANTEHRRHLSNPGTMGTGIAPFESRPKRPQANPHGNPRPLAHCH